MAVNRRLYVITPFFPADEFLSLKVQAFQKWWNQNSDRVKVRYNLAHLEWVPLVPDKIFAFKSGVTIELVSRDALLDDPALIPRVPKGLAVRLALSSALDDVDQYGVDQRDHSFAVQIDGSRAINFSNITTILDRLVDKSFDVILGQRQGPTRMMGSESRVQVELWEQYLLERWSQLHRAESLELLDSQAGCWGLRLSALSHLPLSAPSYELEFDVIASAVQSRARYTFSAPLEPGDRIGKSGIQNHLAEVGKMPFIAQKLQLSRSDISRLLEDYLAPERGRALPEGYVTALRRHFLEDAS